MKARIASMIVIGTLAGCASTGGQQQARRFTGNPYDVIEHRDVVAGDVCGLKVDYGISREHGATVLLGNSFRRLEVRDQNGARHVTGRLGQGAGNGIVDMYVSPDRLVGSIGSLSVDLRADGDDYRGTYQITDDPHLGDIKIEGRQQMLSLPRAELAVLLPPLLQCDRRGGFAFHSDPVTRQPVSVRFGGPAHYETARAGMW